MSWPPSSPRRPSKRPPNYTAPQLAAYLVAFVFSVYNDFAGYTSLVRGVSGLFGIELSSNFNLPFFSRSFAELWTRWHITLSQWLRDYIYYPISRRMLRWDPSGSAAATLSCRPWLRCWPAGCGTGRTWACSPGVRSTGLTWRWSVRSRSHTRRSRWTGCQRGASGPAGCWSSRWPRYLWFLFTPLWASPCSFSASS